MEIRNVPTLDWIHKGLTHPWKIFWREIESWVWTINISYSLPSSHEIWMRPATTTKKINSLRILISLGSWVYLTQLWLYFALHQSESGSSSPVIRLHSFNKVIRVTFSRKCPKLITDRLFFKALEFGSQNSTHNLTSLNWQTQCFKF